MARSIGRYEIGEELGRGGMATVYLATDTRLDRQVALKLMNQALRDDPAFVARFEREAKTVAALEHSAIVSIYDYGEADDWLFLVMRYMKGGSLRERIARGPLPLNHAYDVVHRIGSALDEAHRAGIIHRDLKPNNILLDQAGRALLSDFGVLKLARGDTTYLTRTGETVGTYAYMSPEQIRGEELDGRSDIYALGIVLYESLTGKHPFGDVAGTSGAMAIAHAHEPVPEIAFSDNPNVPQPVNEVIARAMAKSPENRYTSGAEMAEAMLGALTTVLPTPEAGDDVSADGVESRAEEEATVAPAEPASRPFEIPVRPGPKPQPAADASPGSGCLPKWLVVASIAILVSCIALASVVFLGSSLSTVFTERPTPTPTPHHALQGTVEVGNRVRSLAFSPDGRTLATNWEDTVRLWRVTDGSLLNTLSGHTGLVTSVVFSQDGERLASGSWDMTVRLWRPVDGELLHTLEGHEGWVQSVAFSPDGETLASGSNFPESEVRLWRVSDGSQLGILEEQTGEVESVSISPDGEMLAIGSSSIRSGAKLWRLSDKTLQADLDVGGFNVNSLTFSPDGAILALAMRIPGIDKVDLWQVSERSLLLTIPHDGVVTSVDFSPDGKTLATGSRDGTIGLWRVSDGTLVDTLVGHISAVNSVAFSPDGRILASGSDDGTVRIWEAP